MHTVPAFLVAVFLIVAGSCNEHSSSNTVEPAKGTTAVTIGIQVSPAMALPMVAKDAGFFADEGLDVDLREFTAGKFALQAFLGGSIDFAVSGEVPACLATLQGNELRVVAQVVERTVDEVRVVATRDPNAVDGRDYFLREKRTLATSFGGGPEFYVYSLLNHYGVQPAGIEIVSQKPEDMPLSLETGSVDAIAIFDPFAYIAEHRLGEKAVTYTAPNVYSELYVLCARPSQIEAEGQTIAAMVRALARAADFTAKDPSAAQAIVVKYTKLDAAVVEGVWDRFVFRPALTQALLDTWAAEALWAQATGKLEPNAPIPDFRNVVAPEFLRAVDPRSVTLKTAQ